MPQSVVTTESLAESAAAEEALNEVITDLGFVPSAPVAGGVPEYEAGTTYAKGALSQEVGVVYRSQAAGNKGNEPKADVDFVHWAPVSVALYPVQGSAAFPTATRTQQAHNNKPPASSAATATAAETVGVGAETPV